MAIVVLLVAGVTLVLMAGTHNLRHREMVMQKAQQDQVNLTPANSAGSSADPSEDPMAKTMTGKAAPSFTLVDLEGKKVSLADYKGHPVVLNFWATSCIHVGEYTYSVSDIPMVPIPPFGTIRYAPYVSK